MVTQYDDKGKIFTNVISKKPVGVEIQTVKSRIHGTIHVRPSERVIDELNHTPTFVAVTDADVLNDDGTVAYSCNFLVLNSDQIVWIVPDEELIRDKAE
jgi:hypothetical protein